MDDDVETHHDVLVLEDQNSWKPLVHSSACKVLKIRAHMSPEDFRTPLNVLLRRGFAIRDDDESTGGEDGGGGGDRSAPETSTGVSRYLMVISADKDSDLRTVFAVFWATPGFKTVRIVPNPVADNMCIVRLSINVFCLRSVMPRLDLLPLRRRQLSENYPRRAAEQRAHSVTTISEDADGLTMSVEASELKWARTESGLSGPRGLFCVVSFQATDLIHNDRLKYGFGKMLSASHPDVSVSKFVVYHSMVTVHLTREVPPDVAFAFWGEQFPTPQDISMRLLFFNTKPEGPYFSGAGSPFLRTSPLTDGYLEVTAPYDFTVSDATPHHLRVYRKHYGDYLGIFVPNPEMNLHITSCMWRPRAWMDITILSTQHDTVYRGDVLGRLYFVEFNQQLDAAESCQFPTDATSRMFQSEGAPHISVLGLRTKIDTLPYIVLTKYVRNGSSNDVLTIEVHKEVCSKSKDRHPRLSKQRQSVNYYRTLDSASDSVAP